MNEKVIQLYPDDLDETFKTVTEGIRGRKIRLAALVCEYETEEEDKDIIVIGLTAPSLPHLRCLLEDGWITIRKKHWGENCEE